MGLESTLSSAEVAANRTLPMEAHPEQRFSGRYHSRAVKVISPTKEPPLPQNTRPGVAGGGGQPVNQHNTSAICGGVWASHPPVARDPYMGASAGWPRTPQALRTDDPLGGENTQPQEAPLSHFEKMVARGGDATPAAPPPPGIAAPRINATAPVDPRRHLQSSISEHVWPGGVWGPDQGAMRGTAAGIGMQKLHEFGSTPARTPSGMQRRDMQTTFEGALLDHTFGAPPPSRPTVGTRAHLDRAHQPGRHMDAVADRVIWAKE